MRLAFFSSMAGSSWGGSEELWSRTAAHLARDGHDVFFNCVRYRTLPSQLTPLIAAGAKGHLRSRLRLGRGLKRVLDRLRLLRMQHSHWVRRIRPDLVVISFSEHADNPQIALTCRELGVPYVIMVQAAGPHVWIESRSVDAYRAAYQGARQCFFVADDNRCMVEANLGVRLSAYRVIDNPLTVPIDAAPSWPETESGWHLAYVARLHFPTKSQDLIARVLRQEKWRTRPLTVTMWGADDGFLERLTRLIEMDGLGGRLRYGGYSRDIEQLWSRHHGLLLPSRTEGSSLALLEAMACRRVPIVTQVGRAGELIDDGRTGFIAAAANVELVDRTLDRAWARRHDWRKMGEAARDTILERHSPSPEKDFAAEILAAA